MCVCVCVCVCVCAHAHAYVRKNTHTYTYISETHGINIIFGGNKLVLPSFNPGRVQSATLGLEII